jgi:futalosine hydrolase
MMKMLALLSSMPFESDLILASLNNARKYRIAGKNAFKGKLSGIDAVLFNTGIGKVNAAHAATCIIENFRVKKMITIGVGGAYPESGLNIGDIAIASREICGDDGVFTSKGLKGMKVIGIPLVESGGKKFFNEFPVPTPPLISPLLRGGKGGPFKIKSGNFVTLSAASGTHKRAKELEKRFDGVCENMEGAAIVQVCTIYKIPLIEIRGISNIAGVRDKRKWNLRLASENCQKAVLEFIGMDRSRGGHSSQ